MPLCPFASWDPINGPINSYTGEPFRIVHHVTDGNSYAGARSTYSVRKNEPHFTIDGEDIYQHIDTGKAARSLRNPEGGVETNRASAIQFELVGFTYESKNRAGLVSAARLCRWIEQTHSIPPAWPNGEPLPPRNGKDPGGHNRDETMWVQASGHYGHCHVPENDHWDPAYTHEELRIVMGSVAPVNFAANALSPFAATNRTTLGKSNPEYYDGEADRQMKAAYYAGVRFDATPRALFDILSTHVRQSHHTTLDYSPGRELHPLVDVHPDGKLHSLYTGEVFDPAEITTKALYLEAAYRVTQDRLLAEALAAAPTKRQELLEQLGRPPGYDCEHVVPQAWFKGPGSITPQGDLHHLFTCSQRCNSFRANVPFWEFEDKSRVVLDGCGRKELNRFEPARGQGPAARAVFYFLLRYPGLINDAETEIQNERLDLLKEWHRRTPVDDYELHRNVTIQEKQGNRNPIVDFPELVDRIEWRAGLGA